MDTEPTTPDMAGGNIDRVPLSTVERWSGQWRHLYEVRRQLHDVSPLHIIISQLLTIVVAMLGGLLLAQNKEALLLVGTSLILYPALADLLSSNAAVLTAGLHHEYDQLPGKKWLAVLKSFLKSLLVAVLASCILGVLSGALGVLFFGAQFTSALALAVLAGSLAAIIGFPLMLIALFYSRSHGINPDDVTAPAESALFSIVTLIAIVVASRLIT